MRVRDIPEISKLSISEKILLVEDLWDSIASDESMVPVPKSHRGELDERLRKYQSAQGNLLSLEELRTREEDVISGFAWYETKSPGLGEEFLLIFYACAGEISRSPLLYPKVHGEFRRCLLRRFLYAIYFTTRGNEIIVFGLFHCARDPRKVGHTC
ncbi:MAG: addiction module protein [Chloroflexi bacterium]|nr:addiction module protein [Chloroflexota bacterium]